MSHRIPVLLRSGLAALLVFCFFVYLAGALAAKATDQRMMLDKMQQFADTSASEIDPEEYPRFAAAITGYLKGTADSPQLMLTSGTMEREAFAPHEMIHMADIRGLVSMARALRVAAIALILLAVITFFVLKSRQPEWLPRIKPAASIRIGSAVFLLLIVLIAVWGAIDFEGLFHVFHRLLFANELWLLDPQRDVLLQLMPMQMFVSYGMDLLKENLFLLLILLLALFGLREKTAEDGE